MPSASLWFQYIKGYGRTFPAGPSNRKLHYYNRQSQNQKEHKVDQHECRASVFTYDIRKTPYIAKTNGTSRGYKDESKPG